MLASSRIAHLSPSSSMGGPSGTSSRRPLASLAMAVASSAAPVAVSLEGGTSMSRISSPLRAQLMASATALSRM